MASGLFNLKQQLQGLIQGAWSGTSTFTAPKYLEYLVVAGGGSGGDNAGGGGGAGGLLQGLLPITLGSSYTVTIGAGGTVTAGISNPGNSGANSVFGSITALGGGGGRSGSPTGTPAGGSGGGGGGILNTDPGGTGVFGQGNSGGSGVLISGQNRAGGGGGGAGTVGLNGISASPAICGNGGAGIASSISGTVTTYAGGGGGGGNTINTYSTPGTGGIGGGGAGGNSSTNPAAGSTNSGGGGGAGSYNDSHPSAAGGSGIVIVRYVGNTQYFSGGTVNYISGYVVHTFTASGTLAPLSSPVVNGPTNFLTKSLRFRSSASAYLNRTPASAGSRTTWTWSGWIKRSSFAANAIFSAYTDASNRDVFQFDTVNLQYVNIVGGSVTINLDSTQVFRDPSSWYHIILVVDTTQATSTNRVKMYVNGSQITSFATATYPAQNANTMINNNVANSIAREASTSEYADQYMADVYFIDGQALTPTSFGYTDPITGVWQPIAYTGTYGTNGFHLTFTNTTSTATLGNDTSGNNNTWTVNNISLTTGITYDSMIDAPTLSSVASNYCVLNPNNLYSTSTLPSLSGGNLDASMTVNSGIAYATIGVSSGKWYWEVTCNTGGTSYMIGISKNVIPITDWQTVNGFGYFASNGNKYTNSAGAAYGATYTNGDVIGVALDMDGGTLTFYKNGTSQGTAFSSLSGTYFPSLQNPGGTSTQSFNFGQRAFAYTPPTGYNALNTYNLPVPTIVQSNKFMDATTYTGTGAVGSVTNAGAFKPDLVWVKSRNQAYGHALFDSVRGAGNAIQSNNTNAEVAWGASTLSSFNSNGFGVGADTTYLVVNSSGNTFVGWQWQGGQGFNNTNTSGSITSTVSANTTAGFSVVTYTGTGPGNFTVGHGLGVAPSLIIMKNRDRAVYWIVYTATTGINNFLRLNTTDISTAGTGIWGTSAPTSTVFGGAGTDTSNGYVAGEKIVAYCFAPIPGFSAFGSYTGNGSTTGPFIYTGFQPKYLLVKRTDSASDWYIWDSVRNTFNTVTNTLLADSGAAETSASSVNILSNGFQCASATVVNVSAGTYIYAAFASNPFKYSNAF